MCLLDHFEIISSYLVCAYYKADEGEICLCPKHSFSTLEASKAYITNVIDTLLQNFDAVNDNNKQTIDDDLMRLQQLIDTIVDHASTKELIKQRGKLKAALSRQAYGRYERVTPKYQPDGCVFATCLASNRTCTYNYCIFQVKHD